jgi:hypothetical protein
MVQIHDTDSGGIDADQYRTGIATPYTKKSGFQYAETSCGGNQISMRKTIRSAFRRTAVV